MPSDDPDSRVFGVAYKIPQEQKASVIRHLDFREKNGYEKRVVTFYPYPDQSAAAMRDIVIYIATKENGSFAGHIHEIEAISKQIFEAHGPSGPNREYVFRLADAMRQLFPNECDEHLFELEAHLKNRIRDSEWISS